MSHQIIQKHLWNNANALEVLMKSYAVGQTERVVKLIQRMDESGGKLLICGNGGSAAQAQHLAAELTCSYMARTVKPLAAIALSTDTSAMTAIGNDFGFEHLFSRQIRAIGKPGDVLLAISTSGHSKNILYAVDAANELGMATVGMSTDNSKLGTVCQYKIEVPSKYTPTVQECQLTLIHAICEGLENYRAQ